MGWLLSCSSDYSDLSPEPAAPVVLSYPRIYERLISGCQRHEFDSVILKCFALAANPPTTADGRRHRGYFGLGTSYVGGMLGLYTNWADDSSESDIFIIFGPGDGYGPGDSCPTMEELKAGIYDPLVPVSLL